MSASSTTTAPLVAGLNAVAANGTSSTLTRRYADIGINLSDPIFRGISHGRRVHPDDLPHIISRALSQNVLKLMITGSDLRSSHAALQLCHEYPRLCYATVGVHPCSAGTFEKHAGGPEKLLSELRALAVRGRDEGTVTAFGEIGLDYDRLMLCDAETQKRYFAQQLDLATELDMPLFLHSRAAAGDFEAMLKERLDRLPKRGVVHSFTGTLEEMQGLVKMGFDIGINGCSMKTEENMAVVKEVPLERLQIETDGPWCEMRPSHASAKYLKVDGMPELPKAVKKEKWNENCMVKGRNEPCMIINVAWAIAGAKEISVDEVIEHAWRNSVRMFGLGEPQP